MKDWRTPFVRIWQVAVVALGIYVLVQMLASCTATSSPPPDAAELEACHRVDEACPADMQAYSCFTGSACVFPGEPGAQDWVCCR